MPLWSYSRLNTFESCALQYRFRYVDQIPPPREGIEAFMGSRVHEALEWLYQQRQGGSVPGQGDVLTRYFRCWEQAWHAGVVVIREGMTPDDYRDKGGEAIVKYYRRHHPFEDGEILGLEHEVRFDLAGPGEHKIRGFIDRLVRAADDTVEIHDYKTSGRLPGADHFEDDWQLALYQLALERMGQANGRVRLVWHYLVFDQQFTSTRTPAHLAAVERDVLRRIATVERAAEYPARISPLCRWCAYVQTCPAYAASRSR